MSNMEDRELTFDERGSKPKAKMEAKRIKKKQLSKQKRAKNDYYFILRSG